MNEREVVVYFHVAFVADKFIVNREADISRVMSIDSLLFSLDKKEKKWATFLAREKKISKLLRFHHCTTMNRY